MMILKNLRIWSREGFAEDCYLTVEGSRIHAVGPMSECPMDGESLDCRGYTAYPGFIDAHSHLGMFDDSIGAEGEDGNESTDPITPQLRGIDSVYAMDRDHRSHRTWQCQCHCRYLLCRQDLWTHRG